MNFMSFGKEIMIGVLIALLPLLLVGYYLFQYNQFSKVESKLIPSSSAKVLSLTTSELSKHNTQNDCWIVIYNNVLNVTPYLNLHPGGVGAITPYCGKDASKAFDSIKNQSGHSSYAVSLLQKFTIGLFGQEINPAILNQPVDTTDIVNKEKRDMEVEKDDD